MLIYFSIKFLRQRLSYALLQSQNHPVLPMPIIWMVPGGILLLQVYLCSNIVFPWRKRKRAGAIKDENAKGKKVALKGQKNIRVDSYKRKRNRRKIKKNSAFPREPLLRLSKGITFQSEDEESQEVRAKDKSLQEQYHHLLAQSPHQTFSV